MSCPSLGSRCFQRVKIPEFYPKVYREPIPRPSPKTNVRIIFQTKTTLITLSFGKFIVYPTNTKYLDKYYPVDAGTYNVKLSDISADNIIQDEYTLEENQYYTFVVYESDNDITLDNQQNLGILFSPKENINCPSSSSEYSKIIFHNILDQNIKNITSNNKQLFKNVRSGEMSEIDLPQQFYIFKLTTSDDNIIDIPLDMYQKDIYCVFIIGMDQKPIIVKNTCNI